MPIRVSVLNCGLGCWDTSDDLHGLAGLLLSCDVALLCELERFTKTARRLDQPNVIARTANFPHVAIGKRFDWDGGVRCDAILSRFELQNIKVHSLPHDFLARLFKFGLPGPRVLLEATIVNPSHPGMAIRLGSTRWTNNQYDPVTKQLTFDGAPDRLVQSEASVALMRLGSGPVIWGGDLNAHANESAASMALAAFSCATDVLPGPPDVIDYLLYRGLRAVDAKVADVHEVTDHPLVSASFVELPPNPGLAHPEVPTAWKTITNSGDYIAITREQNVIPGGNAEIVLEAAPNVTWWKEIRSGNYRVWTQDKRKRDSMVLSGRQLDAVGVVLAKAGFMGMHKDAHTIPMEFTGGSRITFKWLKD